MTNSEFEVFKDEKGEYGFRLRDQNGKIIAEGKGCKSKQECLNRISFVKRNAKKTKIAGTEIREISEKIPIDEIDVVEYKPKKEEVEERETIWDYTILVASIALIVAVIAIILVFL
ncbi:hypothetical protein AKJ56_01605 [candidate division MSBL1 archaeon SCGC-AAA382N08]|uniref:DUF1508 domain-containing protein n=1 Tax=candidate division MSBL1 archaeon SCGC-AAA382N08 TaxID=1698285 RepID=A0A133VPC4_9EURY|nr:hypothetical protein AKJ56_01605 [candidate division MSBL1 archaeon SCGC-AAA382N08]